MNNRKEALLSFLEKKLENDPDFDELYDLILEDDKKMASYKEAVCDIVEEYHNDKKDLITIIEELVIVLSATREYELDRTACSEKQERLLWDTGSEVIIKALKATNKN